MTKKNYKQIYFLAGFCFGIVFPIIAFLIRVLEYNTVTAIEHFKSDPLLWIIASAPLFLGGFAYFAGIKQDYAEEKVRELHKSENLLLDSKNEIEKAFSELETSHQKLLDSQKEHNILVNLENAIDDFSGIIAKIGNYDFSINLNNDTKILDNHGNEFAVILEKSISNLRILINEQRSATELSEETAGNILNSTESITSNMQNQISRIEEVYSAIEEIVQIFNSTNSTSMQIADLTKDIDTKLSTVQENCYQLASNIKQVYTTVNNSEEIISNLARRSEQIGEIISVIDDIADQTNLLALNASIEAARAGEQGRGFSVVADEVRKLAERTTSATKEIGQTIKTIQTDTNLAVESMHQGTEIVKSNQGIMKSVLGGIDESVNDSGQITTITDQFSETYNTQLQRTKSIEDDVKLISDLSNHTQEETGQISDQAKSLYNKIEDMIKILNKVKL